MSGFESKREMSQDKLRDENGLTMGFAEGIEIDLQMILLKGIKDLTMQMEDLKRRVALMEKHQRDDGK
jgi:hypothetical protein